MPHSIIQIFKNDYNHTAHPSILEALTRSAMVRHAGYGLDSISQHTAQLLQDKCQCPHAHVHFLPAGTLTNLLAISAFLRPHEAVIAANSAHIEIHETGAVEATGHKILTCHSEDGKLSPQHVAYQYDLHDNEHMVQPRLVYLSQSTELGSVYTLQELTDMANMCKKLGLLLYVDGARLGAAMTSVSQGQGNVPSLADMAALCDAFYIGGTKNGALFGEALVLVNADIQQDFRYLCKQRGAMLAKGWLISAQFEALFQDDLYYALARHANDVAAYLDTGLKARNIPLLIPTQSNQVFPVLPVSVVEALAQSYAFETWQKQENAHCIRFVTAWNTSMEDADTLLQALDKCMGRE